jgi:hypothetical protein
MTDRILSQNPELESAYQLYEKAIASGDQAAILAALQRCQQIEARVALDAQLAELRKKLGYSTQAG